MTRAVVSMLVTCFSFRSVFSRHPRCLEIYIPFKGLSEDASLAAMVQMGAYRIFL